MGPVLDRAPSETSIELDEMPWKRRIPKGVKYTTPPYGVDKLRVVGESSRFGPPLTPVTIAPVVAEPCSLHGPGRPGSVDSDVRCQVLQAAERLYAETAQEIGRRRQEEEEAKAQQR